MAALYGVLHGGRGAAATRTGTATSGIKSTLSTWDGQVTVELQADGTFTVHTGSKGSTGSLVLEGNVNDGERDARMPGTER